MKLESLQALQREYVQSRDDKVRNLHSIWRPILDEFRMNSFADILNFVKRYQSVDDETWLAGQGRVASLNVLVRKMASLIGLRDPEFLVESDNPWDEPVATVLEHAFEAQRRAMDWNGEMQKVALEACLYGTGMVKSGYTSRYLYDEPAWSETVPQGARDLLSAEDKALPYGLSTEYSNFRVQEGMPVMMYVSVADIFYNRGVKTKEDIQRIYHRSRRPLNDVLHDSRYDKKARKDVKTKRWGDQADYWMSLNTYDAETEFVEVIECFDLRSRQYCVFTEFAGTALRTWTGYPFPIQSPYEDFVPIPDPEGVWGIPYALLILGQAQAMNRMRAVVIDQVGRDGKKVRVWDADAVIDPEVRSKIERAPNGANIFVTGLQEYFRDGKMPYLDLDFGGARPEMLQLASLLQQDQAWMSGLTDATRNDTGASDETATAVQHRMEQQSMTVDEFVQRNESFQERAAADVMKITLARWDAQKMVKVIGPDPNIYLYTSVNLARVQGTFTLRVVAGSSMKRDKATQRKQWLELLPRIGEIDDRIKMDQQMQAQTGQPGFVNWYEVLRETLGLFDPTLARKILRADNVLMLVQRLMNDYKESPLWMSPDLERQFQMQAQQAMLAERSGPAAGQIALGGAAGAVPGGAPMGAAAPQAIGGPSPTSAVPFEVANGVPGMQSVGQASGGLFSEMAGMVGRN